MSTGRDIRGWMFTYRSYTPLPFLLAMVIFARPTLVTMLCGLLVVLVGESIRFWGVSIVGSETRTTGGVGGTFLIVTGPYAYVRNPLYVGNMLLYTGVGIMSWALFPWLFLAAIVWFYVQYYLIVTREEEYLAERFSGAFAEYCLHVPRFIPRLMPYRTADPPPKSFNVAEGLASERRTLQAIVLVTLLIGAIYFIRG
jgi:protein-S-isoprenylcysteine O-methyltransferase Ste14